MEVFMSRKIFFCLLVFVGFSLLIYLEGIPKAGEEAIINQFRAIPVNSELAFFADPIRGDANGDGQINAGDVVYLIVYLFRGGPPPPTLINGDANGDGVINIVDMVYLLNYLFLDGPPLPPQE
jgi:hypothetical protein